MGLSISWVAAEGVNRSAMLGALGLADVGRPARGHPVPPPAKLAAFELGGWVFVISPDRRFASRERVSAVSQAGSAVGAYLEEHVMVSGAFGASDGRLAWSVQHDPEFGQEHLDVWGEPPAALTGIRARLLQELRTDDDDDVDYLFDAPTELAATVCGFDPNQFSGEVDMLELSVVRRELMKLRDQPLASALADPGGSELPTPRKPGLLARFFGQRRG